MDPEEEQEKEEAVQREDERWEAQEEKRVRQQFEEQEEEEDDDLYEWNADEWEGVRVQGDVATAEHRDYLPPEEVEAQAADAGVSLYDEGVEKEGLEEGGGRGRVALGGSALDRGESSAPIRRKKFE